MIRQPVEDGTQRQAWPNILTPVGPARTGPYKTLHGNNGTGAGVLRDAALIIDTDLCNLRCRYCMPDGVPRCPPDKEPAPGKH